MDEHFFHFFGLRQNPFHASPDARFYFSTNATRLAFAELMTGVEARRGLFVLTGEAGTGKTTFVRHFLDWMETQRKSSCYIFHSQLKPLELFELILQDFDVPCRSHDKRDLQLALNRWLIERRRLGDSPVLIIDEAQTISLRTLDRLNMFLNLELEGSKLLQIILAGQPELNDKLSRPELWKLQQRIISRSRLQPLSPAEARAYIKSRLEIGGAKETIFSDESLDAVHLSAQGIPRVINLLCEHALALAYAEKSRVIGPEVIRSVATDFDLLILPEMANEKELPAPVRQLTPVSDKQDVNGTVQMNSVVVNQVPETSLTHEVVQTPAMGKWPIAEPIAVTKVSPSQNRTAIRVPAIELSSPAPVRSVITSATPKDQHIWKQEPAQQPERTRLPANWIRKRSNFAVRFIRYCREVEQSFVRDWKHFLQSRGQHRTAPGAHSINP